MAAATLPSGREWAIVDRQTISAGRVRLLFLIAPHARRWVTIDRERDTPDTHTRIVEAIRSQSL